MPHDKAIYEVNVFDTENNETLIDDQNNGFLVVTSHLYDKDGKPYSRINGLMHHMSSEEIVQVILWTIRQDAGAKLAFETAFKKILKEQGEL